MMIRVGSSANIRVVMIRSSFRVRASIHIRIRDRNKVLVDWCSC